MAVTAQPKIIIIVFMKSLRAFCITLALRCGEQKRNAAECRMTPYIVFWLTERWDFWQACPRAKSVRCLTEELHLTLFPQRFKRERRLVETID